jgi:hypothetical protein
MHFGFARASIIAWRSPGVRVVETLAHMPQPRPSMIRLKPGEDPLSRRHARLKPCSCPANARRAENCRCHVEGDEALPGDGGPYEPSETAPASLPKPVPPRPLAGDAIVVRVKVGGIAGLAPAQGSGSGGASGGAIAEGTEASDLRDRGRRAERQRRQRRTIGQDSPHAREASNRDEC